MVQATGYRLQAAEKMNFIKPHYFQAFQSNLGIALYLLPSALRGDALLFYDFCHELDELIDGTVFSSLEKENLLNELLLIFKKKEVVTEKLPFLSAPCATMINRRSLDRSLLCELICGMQMDLSVHRYATFEQLHHYAWRVASSVGLISTELFGAEGEQVKKYAEALGIALQLTNILRDVAEDAGRGRIYLPLEDLERFHVTEKEILQARPSPQATHLFNYEAERALSFFAKATLAWNKIPPSERHCMRPARLMEAIYRELLQKMKNDCFDLFYCRYRLSFFEKARLTWSIFFINENS